MRLPCEKPIDTPLFQATHFTDEFPLRIGDRLHRQTCIFDERHVLELRLRLYACERDGFRQWLVGDGRNGDPWVALSGARIGKRFTNHFADADNLLLVTRVIEKELVALFHLLEVPTRRGISHVRPRLLPWRHA